MKSQKLISAFLFMLPGAAFARDVPVSVTEPSVLGLVVAGVAVGVLVYRNKRK